MWSHSRLRKPFLGLVFWARCMTELRFLLLFLFFIGEKNERWNILFGLSKPRITATSQLNNHTWDIRKPSAETFRREDAVSQPGCLHPGTLPCLPTTWLPDCPHFPHCLPHLTVSSSLWYHQHVTECQACHNLGGAPCGREGGMRKQGDDGEKEGRKRGRDRYNPSVLTSRHVFEQVTYRPGWVSVHT